MELINEITFKMTTIILIMKIVFFCLVVNKFGFRWDTDWLNMLTKLDNDLIKIVNRTVLSILISL